MRAGPRHDGSRHGDRHLPREDLGSGIDGSSPPGQDLGSGIDGLRLLEPRPWLGDRRPSLLPSDDLGSGIDGRRLPSDDLGSGIDGRRLPSDDLGSGIEALRLPSQDLGSGDRRPSLAKPRPWLGIDCPSTPFACQAKALARGSTAVACQATTVARGSTAVACCQAKDLWLGDRSLYSPNRAAFSLRNAMYASAGWWEGTSPWSTAASSAFFSSPIFREGAGRRPSSSRRRSRRGGARRRPARRGRGRARPGR